MKDKHGCKIYVGNLPARCTEKDLEDLCKQYGNIERADIVKNFGFVIYASKEDAEKAVERLNHYEFHDSRLQVEIARSKLHVDDKDDNQCYECGRQGHWARECPKRIANGGRRGPAMRGPPPRDSRRPPARGYDDYGRGYDRSGPYDRPPSRGYDSYDSYDRGPPRRPPVEYPGAYRARSRSPRRDYPPARDDPYAYSRDPYYRDNYYSRDSYYRDSYASRYDPYAEYRKPPSNYASPYETSQAKRYGDSSAQGRY